MKYKYKTVVLVVCVFVFGAGLTLALADTGENEPTKAQLLEHIKRLEEKISALEEKMVQLEGKGETRVPEAADRKPIMTGCPTVSPGKTAFEKIEKDLGLKVGVNATMIAQNALDTNRAATDKEDVTDGSYRVDINFYKAIGDEGEVFAQLEGGDGASVTDELEVFSNVDNNINNTATNATLTRVRYDQYLFDSQLVLGFGKIDPTDVTDQNLMAGCDSTQFLASIFNNAPTFDVPSKAPGIVARMFPQGAPWLELHAQVLTGDGSWEDMGNHLEIIPEVNIKPNIANLTGNYRMYGWYRNTDYTEWSNVSRTKKHRYGFGVSIDQEITDVTGIFGRYGWADPDVYDPNVTSSSGSHFSLEQTWSVGLAFKGNHWGRGDDSLGVAVGMVIPSGQYKKYGGTNLKADDEGHAEVYYRWQFNNCFALSPDLQFVWNPFGNDYIVNGARRDSMITILGLRAFLDF